MAVPGTFALANYLPGYHSLTGVNYSLPINQRIGFSTQLTPEQEMQYQQWAKGLANYNPNFASAYGVPSQSDPQGPLAPSPDYDYRAAWLAMQHGVNIGGLNNNDQSYHLNDIGKLPNHESFSNESAYAPSYPDKAGMWTGTPDDVKPFQAQGSYQPTYIPPLSGFLQPRQ